MCEMGGGYEEDDERTLVTVYIIGFESVKGSNSDGGECWENR